MNAVLAEPKRETAPAPVIARSGIATPRWGFVKNPFTRKEAPKAAAGPVQCELALDLVKPVRNDLNDADLEVVPVAQPVTLPPPKIAPPEPTGFLWSRLTSRLFGAGRS